MVPGSDFGARIAYDEQFTITLVVTGITPGTNGAWMGNFQFKDAASGPTTRTAITSWRLSDPATAVLFIGLVLFAPASGRLCIGRRALRCAQDRSERQTVAWVSHAGPD